MFFRFDLTYIGTTTLADNEEPKGFTGLNSALRRDFDSSGVMYKLTDTDLKLGFPGTGKTILEGARDAEGVDATVTLEIFERADPLAGWVSIYTGQAIMENLVIDHVFANVDFEEISLLKTINDRLAIPVALQATEDLEGNVISAATSTSIPIQGRPLLKEARIGTIDRAHVVDLTTNVWSFTDTGGGFTQPKLRNPPNMTTIIDQIVWDDDSASVDETEHQINSDELFIGGVVIMRYFDLEYTADITVSGNLLIRDVSGGATGTVELFLRRQEDDGTTSDTSIDSWDMSDAAYNGTGGIETISFTLTQTVTTNYTYSLYFDSDAGVGTMQFTLGFNQGIVVPGTYQPLSLGIVANTKREATSHSAYFIHEAIRHNLEVITGNSDAIDAPYIGRTEDGYIEDGDAAGFVEMNGASLRTNLTRDQVSSLSDRLESLISMFNVGWGVEKAYGDANRVKIAPREYFYQDVELESFTNIEDKSYSEEYSDEFAFNEVQIGYKKFVQDDNFTATTEDFNTESVYSTPIKRLEGSKKFLANYIASDVLLEITRRRTFEQARKESWKYDDDLFILGVHDDYGFWQQGSGLELVNDGIDYGGLNPINLRINPRFNMYNFFSLINSQLFGKPISSVFRNTEYKINGDEKIYYSGTGGGTPKLGDTAIYTAGTAPQVNANVTAPFAGVRLFDPFVLRFRTAMTDAQEQRIIDGHQNNLSTGNYGYISFLNPDGVQKQGWVLDLSYNKVDKIGTFALLKKADNYGN